MIPYLLSHQEEHQSGPNHDHNNCNETLKKVEAALDGQLSADEEKDLWDHLQKCNGCLDRYHIEKDFKSFLHARINRVQISPEAIENIRFQIQSIDQSNR